MQISLSNNPLDKLDCFLHNKKEELSRVIWLMGERKKVKCRICGDVMDSYKDVWSPMQAGWHKVDKYNNWICHNCFDHRNFMPFIEAIDEADRKYWEEHDNIRRKIDEKAQEVIDLLKVYIPEYKEFLDLYYLWDIECDYEEDHREKDFLINITDKKKEYELRISNCCISKVCLKDNTEIEIVDLLEDAPGEWTWDNAIEVIKKKIEENNI